MRDFIAYLSKETRGKVSLLFFSWNCIWFSWFISWLAVKVIYLLGGDVPLYQAPSGNSSGMMEGIACNIGTPIFSWQFPLMLSWWAFREELWFRLPLAMGVRFFGRHETVIWMAFASSLAFGALHGNWLNIPVQGSIGLIYCLAFLKLGAFRGKILKPLLLMTLIHASQNIYALLPGILSGQRYF